MELLMKEIENAVSLRTEFSTMEAVDIRRAARILVSNGIPTLGELRITPRRSRVYLAGGACKDGYPYPHMRFFIHLFDTLRPVPKNAPHGRRIEVDDVF